MMPFSSPLPSFCPRPCSPSFFPPSQMHRPLISLACKLLTAALSADVVPFAPLPLPSVPRPFCPGAISMHIKAVQTTSAVVGRVKLPAAGWFKSAHAAVIFRPVATAGVRRASVCACVCVSVCACMCHCRDAEVEGEWGREVEGGGGAAAVAAVATAVIAMAAADNCERVLL
jgi:hypothetical protein